MSFAFARGFLALGAFVGELRLFGGMICAGRGCGCVFSLLLPLWRALASFFPLQCEVLTLGLSLLCAVVVFDALSN